MKLQKKYPSVSKISNGPFNPNALKGGRLKGELILEVPVQNKPISQTSLDEATKNRIIIRDIKGKVYNWLWKFIIVTNGRKLKRSLGIF